MNKSFSFGRSLFTFIGVICLTFLLVNNASSAASPSVEQKEIENNLIKIDTQGIDAEIYVDPTQVDNVFFPINGDIYVIQNNKLVKDTSNAFSGSIKTYAIDSYYVTLENGNSYSKPKTVAKGTTMLFGTYGPAELRKVEIYDPNIGIIASFQRAEYGVSVGMTAKNTANHSFIVTNYSANTQTWEGRIEF